jgi:hypothetical protein
MLKESGGKIEEPPPPGAESDTEPEAANVVSAAQETPKEPEPAKEAEDVKELETAKDVETVIEPEASMDLEAHKELEPISSREAAATSLEVDIMSMIEAEQPPDYEKVRRASRYLWSHACDQSRDVGFF